MAMQQSEEQATRNGIGSLETAFSSILASQQHVQTTAMNVGYGGRDGQKFKLMLDTWDGHVDRILLSLDQMVDELNNTLTEHGELQGSTSDAIDAEYSRSTAVFDQLNPNALTSDRP